MSRKSIEITVLYIISNLCICSCPSSIQIDVAYTSQSCDFIYKVVSNQCLFQVCYYKSNFNAKIDSSGWSECFNQCCSQAKLSNDLDTIDLLLQCQQANIKKRKVFIILLSTLLSAALIMAGIILVCINKKSCFLYKFIQERKQKYKQTQPQQQPKEILLQEIARAIAEKAEEDEREGTLHDLTEPTKKRQIKPELSPRRNIKLIQSKCNICLQIRPTCQLNCGHFFHAKCLGLWLQKSSPYMPCGDQNVRIVRAHCQSCMREFSSYSLHKFKVRYRKGKRFLCSNCKKP